MATIDATKIMLELPEPEIDKEDILFQENKEINPDEKLAYLVANNLIGSADAYCQKAWQKNFAEIGEHERATIEKHWDNWLVKIKA
jgi:hypothetical protein